MAPTKVLAAVSRTVGADPECEQLTLGDPGPGQLRVRLGATALCHSDLSYIDGDWTAELPAVWGHEAAGVVESIGPSHGSPPGGGASRVGERVVVSLVRSCGSCRHCRMGDEVVCSGRLPGDGHSPLRDSRGHEVGHGLGVAAFAEAVVVHQSQVAPVPDTLSLPAASLLGCGVLTGTGAVRHTSPVSPGQSVAVIGAGGVGLSAIQAARICGAATVVAYEPDAAKRALAVQLGADVAHDPSAGETPDHATTMCRDQGHLADHVFVTTGAAAALELGEALVGPGGALVLVGMPAEGVAMAVDPAALAGAGRRIVGSKMGSARISRDVPWLADRVLDGTLDVESMIGRTLPLDALPSALGDMRNGRGTRSVVEFAEGPS